MRTIAHIAEIQAHFAGAKKSVYTPKELDSLLYENRQQWNIPRSCGARKFQQLLTERIGLKQILLISDKSKAISRLVRGKPSNLEIGASLISGSYFSHQTAALIHSLIEITPRQLFVNKEQGPKPRTKNNLTQEALDRVFSNHPRTSTFKYRESGDTEGVDYIILSGKFTQNRGVEVVDHSSAGEIRVTNIPRTLIDLVVRPQYLGSPALLLKIFRNAKPKIEPEQIVSLLRDLDYVYPYQQSVGFLMQRADFPPKAYRKLKRLVTKFDFYLAHRMDTPRYDPEWKLFYPAEF